MKTTLSSSNVTKLHANNKHYYNMLINGDKCLKWISKRICF